MGKYILAWFPLVLLAIANGAARQGLYAEAVGELTAHQISTATGVVLFGLYFRFIGRRWPVSSRRAAWRVGFLWLGMTVAFEFLFGHYVMGNPWDRLIADYDIFNGRLWILVLVWVTAGPSLLLVKLSQPNDRLPDRETPQ